MRLGRLRPLLAVTALCLVLAACGSSSKGKQTANNLAIDPRNAPTATLPSLLPSPIAAGPVGTPLASSAASSVPSTYTVKAGDTLAAIAARLGVSLTDLQSYNPDVSASSLRIGQQLKVPSAAGATAVAAALPTGVPVSLSSATPAAVATLPPGNAALPPTPSTSGVSAVAPTTAPGGVTGAQSYKVQAGDNACKIAARFQISIKELAEANGTTPTGLAALKIGQQLKIPAATGSPRGC